MPRLGRLALLLVFTLGSAPGASAVSLCLEGPTSGLVCSTGSEDVAGLSEITLQLGLDEIASIRAYELELSWDPASVALVGAEQLAVAGGSVPDFNVAPAPGSPAGSRVFTFLDLFDSSDNQTLFSATFSIQPGIVFDDQADVRLAVWQPGTNNGFTPELNVSNPVSGASLTLVPEPGTLLLVASGLAGLAARRRSPTGRR